MNKLEAISNKGPMFPELKDERKKLFTTVAEKIRNKKAEDLGRENHRFLDRLVKVRSEVRLNMGKPDVKKIPLLVVFDKKPS